MLSIKNIFFYNFTSLYFLINLFFYVLFYYLYLFTKPIFHTLDFSKLFIIISNYLEMLTNFSFLYFLILL